MFALLLRRRRTGAVRIAALRAVQVGHANAEFKAHKNYTRRTVGTRRRKNRKELRSKSNELQPLSDRRRSPRATPDSDTPESRASPPRPDRHKLTAQQDRTARTTPRRSPRTLKHQQQRRRRRARAGVATAITVTNHFIFPGNHFPQCTSQTPHNDGQSPQRTADK